MTALARLSSMPMTMRSGRLKSSIAAPSRRNSGLETTAKSASGRVSRMIRSTSSPVPTGTVDLVTTTVSPSSPAAISRAACVDKGKIGMAVAAPRRRADRNEDGVATARPPSARSVEKESRRCRTLFRDKIVQAGFEDRHFPRLQGLDFLSVAVNANDRMSEIRETRPRHEPHVARTDHCNVHLSPPRRR